MRELNSFDDLLAYPIATQQAGRSSSTTGAITLSPTITNGETWFSFFAAGGSLEIARIDMAGGTMTRTSVINMVPGGADMFVSGLNEAGTSIVTDSVLAGNLSLLKFSDTFNPDVIESMFRTMSPNILGYYYETSLTNTDADLRVLKSRITAKDGVVFASYRNVPSSGSASSVWSLSTTSAPAGTPARNGVGSTGSSGSILYEKTISDDVYILPQDPNTASTTARLRNYTLYVFK